MVTAQSTADFRQRVSVAALLVVLGFCVLLFRFVSLQLWKYSEFSEKAEENRIALVPIQAPRGRIYDRNGEVIARNDAGFSAVIDQDRLENIDDLLDRLRPLIDLTPSDERRIRRSLNDSRHKDPVVVRSSLPEQDVAILSARLATLPGLEIIQRSTRVYPSGAHASHALGHIGRISQRDLALLAETDDAEAYRGVTHIGKLGLEQSYEEVLRGKPGYQQLEVTASGRVVRELGALAPQPGKSLHLSLDFSLQRKVEEAYGDRRGAFVALDPRNGEVLALVSMPTFDPNRFVDGIDPTLWDSLNTNPDKPLLNRATRGAYPPGSTYKPFMAIGALASGTRKPSDTISDPGYFMLGSHKFRDSRPEGHGTVDLKKSIVVSSDTYYYKLAMDMGVDTIHEQISRFGFGRRTGIDIRGEVAGILPSSEWKKKRYGKPWLTGETPSIGIGQGYNNFTMLQLARATASLANGGKLYKPRMVREVHDPLKQTREAVPPVIERDLQIPADWLELVRTAMVEVNLKGTGARVFAGATYAVAGKTGTAQVFSLKQNEKYNASRISERLRDHSLYIAFAPADNPVIALALIVENGGFGAQAATPIARMAIDHVLGVPGPEVKPPGAPATAVAAEATPAGARR